MSNPLKNVTLALALVLPAAIQIASAQSAPPSPPSAPQRLDPKACSNQERLPLGSLTPGNGSPGNGTQGSGIGGQNLSEKLEQTDGVLCPPLGIDPDIVEAPPGWGRTPVIPPPGSPGGDPTVRPK